MSNNYKQDLVLSSHRQALDLEVQGNANNDRKAGSIITAGSILIAVAGLIANSGLYTFNFVPTIFAFLLIAVVFVVELWPLTYRMPHSLTWDDQFNLYLNVTDEECFDQELSNYLDCRRAQTALNEFKSRCVRIMGIFLVAQIVSILWAVI